MLTHVSCGPRTQRDFPLLIRVGERIGDLSQLRTLLILNIGT